VDRARTFLRQHVIALLALTLVVGGGAAFAAGTKLPKNSVASKQVKNNSLKGKDLKDKSVTGTDLRDGSVSGTDLGDGTVTGEDLANGTVAKTDLAPDAADEVKTYYYSAGGSNVVWSDPNVGAITLSLDCSTFAVNSFVSVVKSPARGGSFGLEDVNQGSEPAGTTPLIGAATVQRLGDVGQPVGGAGFGGSKFGFGQITYFIQTPTLDVFADINVSLCSARGTISIDHKPEGSVIARAGARGAKGMVTCESSGAAYCTKPTA